MQECNKRIKALQQDTTDAWAISRHLQTIYAMISKLAEYKQE